MSGESSNIHPAAMQNNIVNESVSYEPAEFSMNPLKFDNWNRLFVYIGASFVVALMIYIIIVVLLALFGDGKPRINIGTILVVGLLLYAGAVGTLSLYEKWRGCNFRNVKNVE